jgi:hypothetical protein
MALPPAVAADGRVAGLGVVLVGPHGLEAAADLDARARSGRAQVDAAPLQAGKRVEVVGLNMLKRIKNIFTYKAKTFL